MIREYVLEKTIVPVPEGCDYKVMEGEVLCNYRYVVRFRQGRLAEERTDFSPLTLK